jgi:hypothetical protein
MIPKTERQEFISEISHSTKYGVDLTLQHAVKQRERESREPSRGGTHGDHKSDRRSS